MGYVLRVRFASFFAGAATASFLGLYFLYNDYKVAHQSFSQQVKGLHKSLDCRVSALEQLKQTEALRISAPEQSKQTEASQQTEETE